MPDRNRPDERSIIFVADYVPRQCGIATFTSDLCRGVAGHSATGYRCGVVAINDIPEGYRYDATVCFEVREAVQADYRQAAEFINISDAEVVCLQHEYGIFGGRSGSHVLAMLSRLRRPLVTTLHTVLNAPTEDQKRVLTDVCRLSSRVIVMAKRAVKFLREIYEVPAEKIVLVPHGIPDVPFVDPAFYKDKFGVEGRELILTFGLLSPGKGIEYVIQALPAVTKRYPKVVYMIVGATHPHVRRESGEEYRARLQRMARELGVDDNVIFQNRFVEQSELCEFLCAADIYVTPYLSETQIVSGTLAYALGTGNPIISTPYWYAQEVLAEDRGRLVPFQDHQAIAEQLLDLLDNDLQRDAMRKRAYQYSREMVWSAVGERYLEVFAQVQQQPINPSLVARPDLAHSPSSYELPEIDFRHLRALTDDTGILQHSLFATPDPRYGYTTDDNARALIVAATYWHQTSDETILPLLHRYLSFLSHALDRETGRFRNVMNYNRTWAEAMGSEDSHARALWGLGMCIAACRQEPIVGLATRLLERGLSVVDTFVSPRAWAFVIVGIHAYLQRFGGDSDAKRCRAILAERLYRHFADHMTDEWPWCEDVVTYANAKLPHALLMSGKWMFRSEMIEAGERSLRWLLEIQTAPGGQLSIIGTEGWFPRDAHRARFDQQPIEAHALIDACIEAYNVTGGGFWLDCARRCFNWFLGQNDIQTPLYDFTTGGCRDGLHSDRVNRNQGAESLVAWLMSLLLMQEIQTQQTLGQPTADRTTDSRSGLDPKPWEGKAKATGQE